MRPIATAALLAALVLGGCGGHRAVRPAGARPQQRADEAESARARALARIPSADRSAYFEIAEASGRVRAAAAAVLYARYSRQPHAGRAALASVQRKLSSASPHDPALAALRRQTLAAIAQLRPGRPLTRTSARRTLAVTASVNAGLRAYGRRHPAIAALVPD
ncbi:MAG TPA: hypothetical protein VHE14_08225 [Solirubrobacteraceae bacterium]|nr:hypothetical protein [Solirubrobacteraceae bacterium]